jgi:hypothetical protein
LSLLKEIRPGSAEAVDIAQALFLISMLNIFSIRKPGENLSYDYANVMNTVRKLGIFDAVPEAQNSDDWLIWVQEEAKKRYFLKGSFDARISFHLLLVDCKLVMCFAQRPSIPIFEIQHTIQCHEDIWNAPIAEEWRRRRDSMPVNKSVFPWLVYLMTSNQITAPPPDLTVLGAFCILHGIPPLFRSI